MIRLVCLAFVLLPGLACAQPLALTHVTVIDATGAPPRPDMTVLIDAARIKAVGRSGETALPGDARTVDAAGKFLIPGLWDMHVHWNDAEYLALFVANGVTGVRVMWGEPRHLEQRRKVAAGELVGPRMALAGTIVDGPKPFWKGSIAVGTEAQGREAVRRTRAEGYDFVKIYNFVPREAFFAIADEAKKQGIPFVGHVPNAVGVAAASDAGMKSVEHLTGMLLAVSSAEAELRREFTAAGKLPAGPERRARQLALGRQLLESYDADRAVALYAKLKSNGTWQVPTFTVLRVDGGILGEEDMSDPRLRFMPAWVRTMWRSEYKPGSRTPEELAHQKRVFQRRLDLTGEMHRAGVGILAGSDVLNPYCFPGFSLHDELEWLVKAGLSPMAALQSATRDAALYLGRAHELGTVEPGKIADLVLLDADPAQDIRNMRRIAAVVVGGKLLTRQELDRLLADIERLAGAS